jgi:hypothetical protein
MAAEGAQGVRPTRLVQAHPRLEARRAVISGEGERGLLEELQGVAAAVPGPAVVRLPLQERAEVEEGLPIPTIGEGDAALLEGPLVAEAPRPAGPRRGLRIGERRRSVEPSEPAQRVFSGARQEEAHDRREHAEGPIEGARPRRAAVSGGARIGRGQGRSERGGADGTRVKSAGAHHRGCRGHLVMVQQEMSSEGSMSRSAVSGAVPVAPSAAPLGLGLALVVALSATLAGCAPDNEIIKLEADDLFYQLEAGKVDVLLMVDNSGSMAPYQRKLSTNFDLFLTYFIEGNVDYHIGVVTSSVVAPVYVQGSGCSQTEVDAVPPAGELVNGTYITPSTDDGDALFQELVSVGTCGSGYEMGLESAYLALTEPNLSGPNEGFLRDDAYLSVIFVTDEQDSSPLTVNGYINAFRDVKGQRNRDVFNASALAVTDIDECSTQQVNSGAKEGSRYVDVAEQTDGVLGSICSDDFGDIVTELSLASSRLTDTFYLSHLPDPETLVVAVDGEDIDCESGDWRYERGEKNGEDVGMIVFERAKMPPPQSRISVGYDFGTGDASAFCKGK